MTYAADLANSASFVPFVVAQQGRLEFVSATQIRLSRYRGRHIWINGRNETIPSGGVTLGNSGMSASTLYYIYAFMSSGVMTLEYSATSYVTDTTSGVAVKSGDASRTLVGMVFTNASSQFTYSQSAGYYVRSWANDDLAFMTILVNAAAISSSSLVEISAELRLPTLMFTGESVALNSSTTGSQSGSATGVVTAHYLSVNGGAMSNPSGCVAAVSAASGYTVVLPNVTTYTASANGRHVFTIYGHNSGVGTVTFLANGCTHAVTSARLPG